jgi:hypothetical protein
MKIGKWMTVVLTGGLLLSLESCASDLGYYLLNTLLEYVSDLLDTTTTTS